MIKRKFFPLMWVMASTMMLTSCLKNTGFRETMDLARIVTIERNTNPYGSVDSVRLIADYTGESFRPDNLTPAVLDMYGLENAERAIANMHYEAEGVYDVSLTLTDAKAIKVESVWNKPLPEDINVSALTDLYRMQLDVWSYPLIWMADKYLNVAPVIHSASTGSYYLQPTAVYGDTLRFDMSAVFTENIADRDLVDFINFDLTTMADTIGADDATKKTVSDMMNVIDANDSVRIMLVASYRTKGFLGNDTIVKWPVYTDYTKALKTLVD